MGAVTSVLIGLLARRVAGLADGGTSRFAPLYPDETRRTARALLAATIDDIAQNLPSAGGDAAEWARRSLVVQFFAENIGGERFWRVPVMEGEFVVQEKFGMVKGVGGGNFLILGRSADAALAASEAAVDAMAGLAGVILPFPGGVVRSGSKVGSRRIKSMIASTNDAFCPTLRAVTDSALPDGVNSVLEIVINGVDAEAISRARPRIAKQ